MVIAGRVRCKSFSNSKETEIAVAYHLDKLKELGLIHFKYDGRIIDLQR